MNKMDSQNRRFWPVVLWVGGPVVLLNVLGNLVDWVERYQTVQSWPVVGWLLAHPIASWVIGGIVTVATLGVAWLRNRSAPAQEPVRPLAVSLGSGTAVPGEILRPVFHLEVTNISESTLKDCLVKIDAFSGGGAVPVPMTLRTEAQHRGGRSGPFTLRQGETKTVPFLCRDLENRLVIPHEDGTETHVYGGLLILTVSAYSEQPFTRATVHVNSDGPGIAARITPSVGPVKRGGAHTLDLG